MHVRSHLDYCDFIYHIPELRKENVGDEDVFDGYEENAIDHEDENADVETSDLEGRRKINLNFRMRALESIQGSPSHYWRVEGNKYHQDLQGAWMGVPS